MSRRIQDRGKQNPKGEERKDCGRPNACTPTEGSCTSGSFQNTDNFSAHQGVEDDDMNVMCLGARVIAHSLAEELIRTFLAAKFKGGERFQRRLNKVKALEKESF